MKILGIESSCDETAASVVEDGAVLLSSVVATQMDIHKVYGGVVPEVAARSHIEVILPVIDQALEEANCTWGDIDAISVAKGPGLSGSLLIGTLTARTIAWIKNKPLYGVNHVLGHVYANFITDEAPEFPVLALIVSGGHTQLALFKSHLDYQLLGQTQDDAVGEAYDKVAKIIGLPYPGGPSIQEAAKKGNPNAYDFPKAGKGGNSSLGPYDFSFSGVKTAVLRTVQQVCGKDYTFPSFKLAELLSESQRNDFAASFSRVATETLVDKTIKAYNEFNPNTVVIGGGVAASTELRRQLTDRIPIKVSYVPTELCTDNAAMIAALGYFTAQQKQADNPLNLAINPNLSM